MKKFIILSFLLIYPFVCIAKEGLQSEQKHITVKAKNNDKLPRWNLADLYESHKSNKLKKDLLTLERKTIAFNNRYEGKVKQLSGTELYNAIIEYEIIEELATKIGSYSYLLYSTNLNDPEILAFFQNNNEYIGNISNKLLFFQLELNHIDNKAMANLLQNKELIRYKPWLDKNRAFKPYQLTEKEEKILNDKAITSNDYWRKLFDMTNAMMRFPYQGQELTQVEISEKIYDSNEEAVRKEAYLALANTFNKNIELFSLITNALAKDKAINDALCNAPSVVTFRNLNDQVEDEVVRSLVKTVKANYINIAQRYYKLKAKWMGKEKLDPWDKNAPLPSDVSEYIPWTKAKEIVLNAYSNFSPELALLAQKFFDNNWIDAEVYPGKNPGAYSHSTVPSVHPYILMNYQGRTTDVMTLAHELGHGVHQILASKNGALLAGAPLNLSETASVLGEQLVFEYLMNIETNPKQRKIMIAKKIEDYLDTIFRQITFYEFEYKLHTARKQGELTSKQIANIWNEINKEYFGGQYEF